MRNYWFPIQKRGFFRTGQEIKGLRGGVHQYAAQVSPQIDAARAEKDRSRMETIYSVKLSLYPVKLQLKIKYLAAGMKKLKPKRGTTSFQKTILLHRDSTYTP
jgi:hypothetical protein